MKIIKIISMSVFGTYCGLMHASEGVELAQITDFEQNYMYQLKDIAPERIQQIAVNSSFAYLLTKTGNVYGTKSLKDLSEATWRLLSGSSAISLIALYPEKDELNKQNFVYATHSYVFKDRLFAYDRAKNKSISLTTHNRRIYKIGTIFDVDNDGSSVLSASTFPSIQLRTQKKLSFPVKNAYLLYAQGEELAYAVLQNENDKRINLFARAIGKKLPYKMHIIWNTAELDSLILNKYVLAKTDSETDLVLKINNINDLPFIAMSNIENKIKTAVIILQDRDQLKIVFNYWTDETVMRHMLDKLPSLRDDQKLAVALQDQTLRTPTDIKKAYYALQPNSPLKKYMSFMYDMQRKIGERLTAVYVTYSFSEPTVSNVLNNRGSHIVLLVYQNTIEGVFVNDLQNKNQYPRKFSINFEGKKNLCTYFDQKNSILYSVTEDEQKNVTIESKNISVEVKNYLKESAKKTQASAKLLEKYQAALNE